MRYLVCLLLIVFAAGQAAYACEPEPGPQHFPVLTQPPIRIQCGHFVVYNGLNGLPCNDIRSIMIFDVPTGGRYIVVGTSGRGLMILDGENWRVSGDGLFNFPEVTVTALAKIDDTSFYAGTSVGIFKGTYESSSLQFQQVAANQKAVMNVNAMARNPEEPANFLVACDRTAGMLSPESFTEFSIPDHLSPTGFSAVISSEFGSFAGCNGGMYQVTGNGMAPYLGEAEKIGWVNSFAAARERLFIASSNGVSLLNKEGQIENLLPGVWATCLAFSASPEETLAGKDFKAFAGSADTQDLQVSDDIFAGLRADYQRLQEDYAAYTRRFEGQERADESAVAVMYQRFHDFEAAMQRALQIENGKIKVRTPLLKGLWTGTQDCGVVLFATNGRRYNLTSANSKLPADHVTAIACDESGETWIGTANAGLMCYLSRPLGGKGKINNLLNCKPTRIRVAGDMLLIGTQNDGMHIYNIRTLKSMGHFTRGSIKDFHKQVCDFAIDREGSLWVVGDAGVFVWNGKAWKRVTFADAKKAPEVMASRITADSNNRIFVCFSANDNAFRQVCFYDGGKLVKTDPESVLKILKASDTQRLEAIQAHSLAGVYMRNFDFSNASAALAAFESGEPGEVNAMLNTEHYLLLGLENGQQKIFDGESYKALSLKSTGNIGPLKNLFRLPGGTIVIQGEEGVSEFDGQHYRLIESPSTGPGFKITDMCPDQLNPETYRISFTISGTGGYARYQESFWEKCYTKVPVLSVAQADRIIFLATPEGVDYLIE